MITTEILDGDPLMRLESDLRRVFGEIRIEPTATSKTLQAANSENPMELISKLLSEHLNTHKIMRLILHPDALSRKLSRRDQLELLAISLSDISDRIYGINTVCIEPRGGDRQGKVLRTEMEDITLLGHFLKALGVNKVGLCMDVAQVFVVHGNTGSREFLEELKSINLPVEEFHISDVVQNKKIKNRVAMEIGTGVIDWKLILPLILQHCNDLLVETLGGIKIFQRSRSYLESLVMGKGNEVLL